MAKTQEAKIKFSADTREFTQQITQANSTMAGLRAEMKLADATFQNTGDKAEYLKSKQRILAEQLQANEQKQSALTAKVEAATRIYGENSREAQEWATKLTRAKTEHEQLTAAVSDTSSAVEKSSSGWSMAGQIASDIVTSGLQMAADAAVDAAKAMVEVGSNFEAAMSEVEAISGASTSELDSMAAKAKELGSTTKFTATEVAEGFKYMSLAGWDTAEAMEAIDGVVNLAAASGMDLGKASDMVTDYLSAFGLEASDAGKMVDEMVFAQSHSNTSTEQLGDAFGNCAANMNAAGQTMETTTAILEAMANQGTKGSEAGTALAAVMRDITSKMKSGSIAIGDTSVKVMDSQGNFRSLVDILADVEAATDGMGSADKAAALQKTFTARSIKAVNQVLNEGVDDIRGYAEALEDSEGAAARAAETMQDNFQGAVTRAKSAAEGLGVAIYDGIKAPLTGIVDIGADVMGALADALTPPANNDLQTYVSGVADRVRETQEQIKTLGNVELSVNADIGGIEAYRAVLEKATKGEELSAFEKYQLQQAVSTLGDSIPGLTEAYDAETGSINLTTEALDALIESTERQIKMDAYSDAIEQAYKAAADAAVEAADAQSGYEAATNNLSDALNKVPQEVLDTWDLDNMDPTVIYDTATAYGVDAEALMDLITAQQQAKTSMDEANAAQKEAEDAAEQRVAAIEKLQKEEDEAADTEKNYAKATGGSTEAELEHVEIEDMSIGVMGSAAKASAKSAKEKKKKAKASEEAAEAEKQETKQADLLTDALGKAVKFGQDHSDVVTDFFEKAGEAAMDSINEKIERAMETERSALETTRKAYEDNYNSIKGTLSKKLSLYDAFDGGTDITVEQMVANLQSQAEGIKQYKQEMAEVIAAYGDELGPDLIATLQSQGADAANTWHHMWVTMSQDNAPELFRELGQQWAEGLNLSDQIASYCAGNLTAYQLATGEMGSTKVEWTGLRESVDNMTPELDAAITAAQQAGVQIPDGLAEGLRSGEMLPANAADLITKSMQGTFQGLYEIAEQSGIDIPAGLSAGMEGSADEYQAAIATLTTALGQAGSDAGTAAATEMGSAMTENASTVGTAASDTATEAAQSAGDAKADFRTAGTDAASEFASGIRGQQAVARAAGRMLGRAAKSGAEQMVDGFDSMVSDIRSDMMQAYSATAAGVAMIRSALAVTLRGPHIQVPHFSMHGSFNAQTKSVPSVSVQWYKSGAVFDHATIIPTVNGYKGVAEAGPEAVSPVSVLQDYISDAVSASVPSIDYDRLGTKVAEACAKMNISIDVDNRELGRAVRRAVR